MFAYCLNNPVLRCDGDGLASAFIGYVSFEEDSTTMYLSRGGKEQKPRTNRPKDSDKRHPTGERERNKRHPNGEEHGRKPKGNGIPIRHCWGESINGAVWVDCVPVDVEEKPSASVLSQVPTSKWLSDSEISGMKTIGCLIATAVFGFALGPALREKWGCGSSGV